MTRKKHLPLFGVGPLIVVPPILFTTIAIVFSRYSLLPQISLGSWKLVSAIFGVLLIAYGVYLWILANFKEKIQEGIKNNQLIVTGVYARTRNPIYTSFLLLTCGAILLVNNLLLFVVPVISWLYMTALLQRTEEKWLLDLYGDEYKDYCKRVHRLFPWSIPSFSISTRKKSRMNEQMNGRKKQ